MTIAQTARIGALMMTCKPMLTTICTCMMSLVERVIRLAVEKRLISVRLNDSTLSKIRPRSRLEYELSLIHI